MKQYSNKNFKQRGFALMDVMIAALVLAVGVIAFIKLENLNIKRSQTTNYRLQAAGSANALIEVLRSNPQLIGWIETGKNTINRDGNFTVASKAKVQAVTYNCSPTIKDADGNVIRKGTAGIKLDTPSTWCGETSDDLRKDFSNEIQAIFSDSFSYIQDKVVMCLRVEDPNVRPAEVRITVVWKNATSGSGSPSFTAVDPATDCPSDYDKTSSPIPFESNASTLTPDRGFYEIFTRI